MVSHRTLHLGRLRLGVPTEAQLEEFSATIGGVELEELDLGDDSPDAGYLAWMQISEQARETSGFDEHEADGNFWIAFYGVSEPRVIALAQHQDSALVLRASTLEHEDAVPRVHDLRKRYTFSPADPLGAFGLGLGLLELRPERPEEFVAMLTCGTAWSVTSSACAVAKPSRSNYEGLRVALETAWGPERRAFVDITTRSRGSLLGEELFFEILGEGVPAYQAIWRDPGAARDPSHPEIELELSLRGFGLDAAREEWERLVSSLRLAVEDEQ